MDVFVALLLLIASILPAASGHIGISKRAVLKDLSGGFCRSYRFSAGTANNVLYLTGLDGGIIPNDGDSSHNYLVQLDLTKRFSIHDGSKYKMSLIRPKVPTLKDQALWTDKDNTTLFTYGGRGASNTSIDNGLWTYTIADKSWKLQTTSIRPVRFSGGGMFLPFSVHIVADDKDERLIGSLVYVNVPSIQSGYWIGGYQSSDTTLDITDKTKRYSSTMLHFNTTTGEIEQLHAPFSPVEQGALVHIPVGELGILVYFGGEVPSVADGIDATLTPNSWKYVRVYDIAGKKWFKQPTTGTVTSRTQFCATVQHDSDSESYQIYVLGGADFKTQKVISKVSYLSIPSFKWYRARSLENPRMTLTCETYGRQIFGIGGRLAWADDAAAGCYDVPAFIYDAQLEELRTTFDPELPAYILPTVVSRDIEKSPYPSKWANPSLASLFTSASSPSSTKTPEPNNGNSDSTPVGPIVGGVVGGVAGVTAIILIACLIFFKSRRRRNSERNKQRPSELGYGVKSELQGDNFLNQNTPVTGSTAELEGRVRRFNTTVHEMQG
ncbi:hypothetical protein FQN55_007122 [Onygenales sp. PD_40]|nr:hypothetical protein FQN55_007122 [Onygenales sp. PD_40]